MYLEKIFKKLLRYFEPRFKFLNYLPPNAIVLDLGCGDFTSTNKIKNNRPDLNFYSIDIEIPPSIPDNIIFNKCNLENNKIPYPDTFFSSIYALHIIEHIGNLRHLGSELNRVLKPEGYIFIEVPSVWSIFAPTSRKFFAQAGNFFGDITHKRIFTEASLYDFVNKYCDLKVVKIGTVRNPIKILAFPLLLIISLIKWKAYLSVSLANLFGWKIYCIGRKD